MAVCVDLQIARGQAQRVYCQPAVVPSPSIFSWTIQFNMRRDPSDSNPLIVKDNALTGGLVIQVIGILSTTTIASGGSGYKLGDYLTVAGGTLATNGEAAVFEVTGVDPTGAVTGIAFPETSAPCVGNYSVAPTNPAATAGGSGTLCTLTLASQMFVGWYYINFVANDTNGNNNAAVTTGRYYYSTDRIDPGFENQPQTGSFVITVDARVP